MNHKSGRIYKYNLIKSVKNMMDLQHIKQGNIGTDLFNSSPAATVLAIKKICPYLY